MAEGESRESIFPEIKILRFPVDIVCGCIGRFAIMLPASSEVCLAEHQPRGAEAMLAPELPFDEALTD